MDDAEDVTRVQIFSRLEGDWSAVSLGPWLTARKLFLIQKLFVEVGSEALPAYIKVSRLALVGG
jgi:hypothetical protein